jgi:hypothetical protein
LKPRWQGSIQRRRRRTSRQQAASQRGDNGGMVRLTKEAFDRTSLLKSVRRNHLTAQVANFRIGDKQAWRRSDDLVDALVYFVLIAFEHP